MLDEGWTDIIHVIEKRCPDGVVLQVFNGHDGWHFKYLLPSGLGYLETKLKTPPVFETIEEAQRAAETWYTQRARGDERA